MSGGRRETALTGGVRLSARRGEGREARPWAGLSAQVEGGRARRPVGPGPGGRSGGAGLAGPAQAGRGGAGLGWPVGRAGRSAWLPFFSFFFLNSFELG